MKVAGEGAVRLLRRYGLWIVLVTVAVLGAAVAVSMASPVVYQSEAVVVVEARVRANTTPVAPEMGTEKELAQSGLIVDPAARSLSITSDELRDGLTVSVAPDANVLTFAYTDPTAAEAQRRASALARSYVSYRNAVGTAAAANSTQRATLVTAAPLPNAPQASTLWINVGVGIALGLLLGIGTAVIRDRMSDRLRGREDFEQVTGVSVLTTVPRVGRRLGGGFTPVILRAPDSAAAESYRYLRSRLQPGQGCATILVTSASEREGRTTVAANVATALALSGREVILVDTDFRRPGIHTAFGGANGAGLTSILAGQYGLSEVLQDSPVPRLRLLTAGPAFKGAADMLDGVEFDRVLRELRTRCSVIVMDSAPVLTVSDPIALARVADHILLVGDYRRTTREFVARAVRELGAFAGRRIGGVLLNAPDGAARVTPGQVSAAAGKSPTTAFDSSALDSSALDSSALDRGTAARVVSDRAATDRAGSRAGVGDLAGFDPMVTDLAAADLVAADRAAAAAERAAADRAAADRAAADLLAGRAGLAIGSASVPPKFGPAPTAPLLSSAHGPISSVIPAISTDWSDWRRTANAMPAGDGTSRRG